MTVTRLWVLAVVFSLGWSYNASGESAAQGVSSPVVNPLSADSVSVRIYLEEAGEVIVGVRGGLCHVTDPEGNNLSDLPKNREITLRLTAKGWEWKERTSKKNGDVLATSSKVLIFTPEPEAQVSVGAFQPLPYRGIIQLIGREKGRVAIVNVVDIETYLMGVVGAEMPASWHLSALRAQAIACRTYALYQMHLRRLEGAMWDVSNDQSSQVYSGLQAEHSRVALALKDTRGVVLTYGPEGKEKLFPAYFSSNCGGHTQDGKVVFGKDVAALGGTECPYCQAIARPETYRWVAVVTPKSIASKKLMERYPELTKLEEVIDIQVTAKSDYGRVERLKLFGKSGRTRIVNAEDFRLAISSKEQPLRSSWYDLVDGGDVWRFENGRGWGHGVGFCQCGSEKMAQMGKDAVAILEHYYPGATLVRAY